MQLSQNGFLFTTKKDLKVMEGFSVEPGSCIDSSMRNSDVIEKQSFQMKTLVADLANVRMNLSLKWKKQFKAKKALKSFETYVNKNVPF